jgi:hypothetical protein
VTKSPAIQLEMISQSRWDSETLFLSADTIQIRKFPGTDSSIFGLLALNHSDRFGPFVMLFVWMIGKMHEKCVSHYTMRGLGRIREVGR